MSWTLALFVGAVLEAQTSMPVGIVRGTVVARSVTELSVRGATGAVSACFYDAHTYFERDHNPISAAGLAAGDPVEVVADRQLGSTACYVRTVQVIDQRRSRFARVESTTESFAPRGDLMFGGIVLRRGPTSVTLKTHDGEKTLVLRPDTRYWCDGVRALENALVVNTRVFVRAGRDFEGHLEIYKAAWGAIVP
jgi:hypothetical protein